MNILRATCMLALCAAPAIAQTSGHYDEVNDGDLSDSGNAPTPIPYWFPGDITISATQQGNAAGRDIDYFTVTIPAGFAITELRVNSYVGSPNDNAFLGVQAGAAVTVNPQAPTPTPLLGGTVYGAADIGNNILPRMGTLAGAIGFAPPLLAGQYSFWLNQTGAPSTVELQLVVVPLGLGAAYCPGAAPNSSGVPGELIGLGSTSIAANSFSIRATNLPPNAFGYLLVSSTAGTVPSTGMPPFLCINGSIGRYVNQVQSSGAAGEITTVVDLLALPQPNGPVAPLAGESWYFQLWHRDVMPAPTPPSNFTRAWAVVFEP
ncbi:MAG: hypothetical protein R3F49_04945 [Planctomycetota bacterium]